MEKVTLFLLLRLQDKGRAGFNRFNLISLRFRLRVSVSEKFCVYTTMSEKLKTMQLAYMYCLINSHPLWKFLLQIKIMTWWLNLMTSHHRTFQAFHKWELHGGFFTTDFIPHYRWSASLTSNLRHWMKRFTRKQRKYLFLSLKDIISRLITVSQSQRSAVNPRADSVWSPRREETVISYFFCSTF